MYTLSCAFSILHTSVALKHPSAAALFEACLLCVHSFLHLPGLLAEQVLQLLAMLPIVGRIPGLVNFLVKLFSFCCRVDNRSPLPSAASQMSLDLLEWNSLTTSAKSAFLSDHEANNSIVQVAASMLQSACMPSTSFDGAASCPAVCNALSCCTQVNVSLSSVDSGSTDDMSIALITHASSESKSTAPSTRHTLRALLQDTRTQLRSMQSPLQRDTHGFDSWGHLLSSLNPCTRSADSAATVSLIDSSDVVRQRCSLHRRMCRINKWQLLLRLHHMPWLRLLRRHALVHPPQQPHLSWRSSNILLSNTMLQAAAAAVSFEVHSHQDPSSTSDADGSAFNHSVDSFHAMMEQHLRMLTYFKSERGSPRAAQHERLVGIGWCCTCESCRNRSNQTGGPMDCVRRMYE